MAKSIIHAICVMIKATALHCISPDTIVSHVPRPSSPSILLIINFGGRKKE